MKTMGNRADTQIRIERAEPVPDREAEFADLLAIPRVIGDRHEAVRPADA